MKKRKRHNLFTETRARTMTTTKIACAINNRTNKNFVRVANIASKWHFSFVSFESITKYSTLTLNQWVHIVQHLLLLLMLRGFLLSHYTIAFMNLTVNTFAINVYNDIVKFSARQMNLSIAWESKRYGKCQQQKKTELNI